MSKLRSLFTEIRYDYQRCCESHLIVALSSAEFQLLLGYRLSHYFVSYHNRLASIIISIIRYRQLTSHASDIHRSAVLGRHVRLPHPVGIVIGAGVVTGDDVRIFQHVTIGSHGRDGDKSYPYIRSGATLYSGSMVLGGIIVGKGAVVGAGSVVITDVHDDDKVVGIPAHSIFRE